MFTIEDLINAEVQEREKREITSWQASKLGSCITGVYLERMGVKPDTEFDNRTLRVFRAGKLFEEYVVGLLGNKEGVMVETQQRVEIPEWDVTGYADVLITTPEKKYVYEIKSKHSFGFKYLEKEGANLQHQMQLWLYLKGLGVEEGRIYYVSKDDLRTAEFIVNLSDKNLEAKVIEEVEILNKAWKEKIPPRPPESRKDIKGKELDWRITYCRWHKNCTAQDKYIN